MKLNFFAFFIVTSLLFTGCVDKTPLSEENKIFAGKWENSNGTSIEISENGTGSVEFITSKSTKSSIGNLNTTYNGNTSVSISGGAVTITEQTLKIALMGLEYSFEIDIYPYEEEGKQKMELDGEIYTRKQELSQL